MEKRFDKIDGRLNSIDSVLKDINTHLASVDITLVKQHSSLEYHIKRTDLLESKIETPLVTD